MAEEKFTQMSFRVPDLLARKFRGLCAFEGIRQQDFFEQAIRDFVKQKENKTE